MKNTELLHAIEQNADYVALVTGFRQQFIDAGWTPTGAEQIVLFMLQQQRAY